MTSVLGRPAPANPACAVPECAGCRGQSRDAPPYLVQNRYGADARARLQDRDDLAIPNIGKWVGPSAATRRFLPGWQARIILDPVAVAVLKLALAAAAAASWVCRQIMYSLIWWSVTWRPGKV
jgi:hypothetical protein